MTINIQAPQVEPLTSGDEDFRAQFSSWNIADLTPVEIGAYLKHKDLILIPIASTEQHGLHLPIGTDTITATAVSRQVSALAAVLHTPTVWTGYSPQHMFAPGEGRGTITLRSTTMMNLLCDIGRSLIHHGFNRLLFVNGHGSNQKVIDPVMRKLKYETGALIGFVNPIMERYTGVMEGLLDNPPEETPGSHASELETCQDLAWDPALVHMDRTDRARVHIPDFLPAAFAKSDGRPDVEFDGYTYFSFPMEYAEITDTGATGNARRATPEKGQEAFRRFSEHIARGVLELSKAPLTVHHREFIDRVL